jgi:acetoacetyl-CoA synthetase
MDKPLWTPGQDRVDRANLSRFMRFVREESGKADLNSYAPLYRFSIEQPAQFWTLLWDFVGIRGSGERSPVLLDAEGMASASWFPGVSLNFAHNLLRFDDDRIAIRCHGADENHASLSYAQLQRRVAAMAAALKARGVGTGDCVAALLPNLPDAVVAMLATASLGAIWFACPGDLAPDDTHELLSRVSPKLVLDSALDDFIAPFADAELEFVSVAFEHPLYLTCAVTADGRREILLHGTGGTLIQHLKELVLHVDLKREDRVFFHAGNDSMAWYWLASSLAIGSTLVLHAGDDLPPNQPALWDLIDEYGITVLGVHSRWLGQAAQSGLKPLDSHRLLSLKTILAAGGALSRASYEFVYRDVKERVLLAPISTGGDTLACFALGAPLLPVWAGEISCRGLGMKVEVLDANGEAIIGELGDLACSAPFPSMPLGFWDDPDRLRYSAAYFSRHEGRWCSGERATLTARESLLL